MPEEVPPDISALAARITREAMDRGCIIEAGWLGLRIMSIPKNAPPVQITEMRNAFFAGASHLFNSIMSALEPGCEPTEGDLRKMTLIQSELDEFLRQFKANNKL